MNRKKTKRKWKGKIYSLLRSVYVSLRKIKGKSDLSQLGALRTLVSQGLVTNDE